MQILWLPPSLPLCVLPASLLACCTPQALLECWGEIKKRPRSEQVRVFGFFISMTFFLWVVNTRDKLRSDRGHSNSNPGLSRRPFKKHALWRMSLVWQNHNTLPFEWYPCFPNALTSTDTSTSGNSDVTFICITKLIKFEQSFTHPAETNVKYFGKRLRWV